MQDAPIVRFERLTSVRRKETDRGYAEESQAPPISGASRIEFDCRVLQESADRLDEHKINGRDSYIWSEVDREPMEVLEFDGSSNRLSRDTLLFVNES